MPRSRSAFSAALLFVCLVATACTRAQKPTATLPYVTTTRGPELADLYRPSGNGPFPAIVYIHGGSWRSGSKKDFRRLASDLAAKGYVGLSINYDLQPGAFPIAWQESQAAVRFLHAHAAEYHVDPAKIVVLGTSAGGQIAALVAIAPEGPVVPSNVVPAGTEPVPVAAAIILNGVFDMGGNAGVMQRYIGSGCAPMTAVCKDASPIYHMHSAIPPFFIGHGTADHTVPFGEAKKFYNILKNVDDRVTFYPVEGGPHSYWEKKQFYDSSLAAIVAFLNSVFPATS